MILTFGVAIGALFALDGLPWLDGTRAAEAKAATTQCASVRVVDGDTFDCGSERIRMYGIDAPEMPGHCRPGRRCVSGDPFASTENLRRLIGGSAPVSCRRIDQDRYGRTVARCFAGELDISCAQLAKGYAERRYGFILCPGFY